MRNRLILAAALFAMAAIALAAPGTRARAAAPFQEAFRGITALSVEASVHTPDAVIETAFNEKLFKYYAVNNLRGHLPTSVTIESDNLSFPDCLRLSASMFRREDSGYYGSVRLEIERSVMLSGIANPAPFRCVVYSHTYLVSGKESPSDHVKKAVEMLLEGFVKAYLAATRQP